MLIPHASRLVRPSIGFLVAIAAALLLTGFHGLRAQSPGTKLTTVLQDLVQAVPQASAGSSATSAVTPLSSMTLPASVQDALHGRLMRVNTQNQVQVYVLMSAVSDVNVRQLQAAGATVEISDPGQGRVQAEIPIASLQAVSALSFVNFIKLPSYGVHRHTGSVTTEGDPIIKTDITRQQFSLDGTGVRVGVLSDGIKGIYARSCTSCSGVAAGPISTNDLPSGTGTRNSSGVLTASTGGVSGRSFQANSDLEGLPGTACSFAGAGAEGTAILEIVHDLAPSAQLAFANADTDLAFESAVNFLASTNDVVIDDLGFYGLAYDGTSPVSANTAAALNNNANPIRTYVTAAGNGADEHYIGNYVDSGVDGGSISGYANTGHLQLFQSSADTTDVLALGPQPYNIISLPTNGEVVIFLTWNDTFSHSSNNYDLYLVQQSTNRVVARSIDAQTGTQDPVESIDYVNTTGVNDFFRIEVQNVHNAAQAKQLNIFSFEPECASDGPRLLVNGHHERHNYNTATQSIGAESDAGGSPVSVISVAAVCSASAASAAVFAGSAAPDESCLDPTHTTLEYYSSRGPTLDGRVKPDVTGIDGVSVTGAGSFEVPFFGTSAAAPHVAGTAALMLQGAPCLLNGTSGALDPVTARSKLRGVIVSNADTLGGSSPNTSFGTGLVDAFASVQHTLPARSGATLAIGGNSIAGATITPTQLGFADPNGCGVTRLSWTGGCGSSPGSTLNCPFGTTHLSVSASNNGVSFSTPSAVDVTVSNFAVAGAPGSATVTAGQSATYQVTVTPQGGAFPSGIALSCGNLPVGTSCVFGTPTITPGAAAAQTSLTITTTSHGTTIASTGWPIAPLAGIAALLLVVGVVVARRFVIAPAFGLRWNVGGAAAVVVAIALVASQSACGSSSTPAPPATTSGAVTLSASSLTFGTQTVGTSASAQTVTLTNSGSAALTIATISATGDFAQTNTCGVSVAAGATCTISVVFTPTSTGARSGALTISDNATTSPQSVTLTGTGSASNPGPTPAGTYQISVAGTSGSLTQASAITLIVQ